MISEIIYNHSAGLFISGLLILVVLLVVWGWRDKKRKNEGLRMPERERILLVPGSLVGGILLFPFTLKSLLSALGIFSFCDPRIPKHWFPLLQSDAFQWEFIGASLAVTSVLFFLIVKKRPLESKKRIIGYYLCNIFLACLAAVGALGFIEERFGVRWLC